MVRRRKRQIRPGKSRLQNTNEDFIEMVKNINKIRAKIGLKPLSHNMITKFLSNKIKRDNAIYNEIIKF